MKDLNTDDFRVREGDTVDLDEWPTVVNPVYKSQKQYRKLLEKQVDRLTELQELQYASNSDAVLLIFQALDAAGKDGAIKHVMSGVNPQGCQVYSFKQPTATELQHDFLWRTTLRLPERGRIGIFNRSYYEDVLIVRVHPELLESETMRGDATEGETFWAERFRSIVDSEAHLARNGTRILKFYLHMSKDEQRNRFLDRIDEPDKNWKITPADIEGRAFWDDYMRAFEQCLGATSTRTAPWYVVPADDKENARLIVSRIIVDAFEAMGMSMPKTSAKRRAELRKIRKELLK